MNVLPLLALVAMPQDAPVSYTVDLSNAVHHEARITVQFNEVPDGVLEIRMSRSSPGRYALHEFAKNVYGVEVTDGEGRRLEYERPNPHQWDVERHTGTVRVTYTLFGDRTDGTYTAFDETHAHMNMPATFMWARQMTERPIEIRFQPPARDWKVATQLVPTGDRFRFTAPDLYYFMDSPTEVSDHTVHEWAVATLSEGVIGGERGSDSNQMIRLAVHHSGSAEAMREFARMVEDVVAQQAEVYGGFPRFDHGTYTFIADYLPWANGDGMEHRNSTILTSSGNLDDNALGLLGTVSHEFFHAWNVERMRPRSLEPFDFERENMSEALWFAEGFTSYYDDLFIRRAGITDDEQYANGISFGLSFVINSPGREYFSPVEMSLQAPFVDAATSVDPQNKSNTFISYYTWGAVIGLGLDLTLRSEYDLTLDHYMRKVWFEHGATETPYTMMHLRNALAELTEDRAFANEFFDRYIEGREVVNYAALLDHAGLLLDLRNPGGAWIGPVPANFNSGAMVLTGNTQVGSPLYEVGVDRGDVILEIDGVAMSSRDAFQELLNARQPGQTVTVRWQSRGEEFEGTMILAQDPTLRVATYESIGRQATDEQLEFRRNWLD